MGDRKRQNPCAVHNIVWTPKGKVLAARNAAPTILDSNASISASSEVGSGGTPNVATPLPDPISSYPSYRYDL